MQFNVFPTCNGKVLDLFYSSINNICVSVTIFAVVSDHLALVAEIPVSVKQIKNARIVGYGIYTIIKKLISMACAPC